MRFLEGLAANEHFDLAARQARVEQNGISGNSIAHNDISAGVFPQRDERKKELGRDGEAFRLQSWPPHLNSTVCARAEQL